MFVITKRFNMLFARVSFWFFITDRSNQFPEKKIDDTNTETHFFHYHSGFMRKYGNSGLFYHYRSGFMAVGSRMLVVTSTFYEAVSIHHMFTCSVQFGINN